jgi:hypothetical protein
MGPILAALATPDIRSPVCAANLAMFPLRLPEKAAPGYLVLKEALAGGLASVAEVSESGSVPDLLVRNRAAQPVLIPDGEDVRIVLPQPVVGPGSVRTSSAVIRRS